MWTPYPPPKARIPWDGGRVGMRSAPDSEEEVEEDDEELDDDEEEEDDWERFRCLAFDFFELPFLASVQYLSRIRKKVRAGTNSISSPGVSTL